MGNSFDKLLVYVLKDVDGELKRANQQFGTRHYDAHHAFAVMLEEYEDAADTLNDTRSILNAFWQATKTNSSDSIILDKLSVAAMYTAAECIQLAAMAKKAMGGYMRESRDAESVQETGRDRPGRVAAHPDEGEGEASDSVPDADDRRNP